MKKSTRLTAFLLSLILCLSLAPISAIMGSAATYSSAVYMIMTNPGEDCNTKMRIGWHSDEDCKDCYVMYTTADDTDFANAIRVDGSYDDQAYKWFYNRLTTNALSDKRFDKIFLDWGVELDDLTPDTEYIYRVYDGKGLYSKNYKFKTAGADEYSIVWMSDAHVNKDYSSRLIDWRKMFLFASQQAKYPIGFQFSTGDSTTSGDRYQDWLSIANESFTRNYMIANVVGNHDVYDGIMYADTTYYTQYWKSGEYFDIVQNNPQNGYTFNSQRINGYLTADGLTQYADQPADTLIEYGTDGKLCTGAVDNTNGRCYWFNYNGLLFIIFEYYSMMSAGDTQAALDWAGEVIKQNEGKYDYIICANHVNLVNGGGGEFRDYGATDYDYFGKFFDEYNVDIFLAGDNHVYLRTNSLFDGAVNTDPQKGTYIIQAPCISRPQSFGATDAAGYAVKQYSLAGKTVGGLVIDVDEAGLTFRCLVREDDKNPQYFEYDSYTVPRKTRAANKANLKAEANFAVNGAYLKADEGVTVQNVLDGFDNTTVEVTDAAGEVLDKTALIMNGDVVTVRNEGFTYPAAVLTVKINGTEPEPTYTLGDVNDDGKVNNLDATNVLKYDAAIIDLGDTELLAADVNADGKVNNLDATVILKYDAGIIDEL